MGDEWEDVPAAPAAATEDHDLDFLKPGFKRDAAPAPAAPDRIGAANQSFNENLAAIHGAPAGGDKVAPYGLSGVVTGQTGAAPADQWEDAPGAAQPPDVSKTGAFAAGAVQGGSLGWADELAARADTLISKVPGLRDVRQAGAEKVFGHPAGALDYSDPNLTYEQRRDAYRAYLKAAHEQHPVAYGGGQVAGGIATAFVPGTALAKGAGAVKVGLQGAALGGAAAAGESEATDAKKFLTETGEGALVGGVGGAVLHGVASKAAKVLATKIPALADKQAITALTQKKGLAGAPASLTEAVTRDPNISAAINEPIALGPKKSTTLATIAGKRAEEVRPVLASGQEKVNAGLESGFHTADAGSGGGAKLADLANHYDAEIGARAKAPGNEAHIGALEGAKEDALRSWGPTEEAIEARKGEIGNQTAKIYEGSDAKAPVNLGDLVKHYETQAADLAKTPGNEETIRALNETKQKVIDAWGTRPVFDPDAMVQIGNDKPEKAGVALAKLEAMAKKNPAFQPDVDRIRAEASKVGFDPTVQIPAKDVRSYATTLQNRGATTVVNPSEAAEARKFLGATTKDFVNGHVEKTMGPAERKALQDLNARTTDLYRWKDILAGKNVDKATRDRVLKEFDTRIPTSAVDKFAGDLETRGTQRIDKLNPGVQAQAKENLGKATRDFVNKHISASASPEDAAAYQKLVAHRKSLANIDEVLKRREIHEAKNKADLGATIAKGAGHAVGLGMLAPVVTHALSGDIPGAIAHGAAAVGAAALPHAITGANAAKMALVRGAARGTDMLAKVVANADAGNVWARNVINTLRQTPAGAARLAAAMARLKVAGGGTTEP